MDGKLLESTGNEGFSSLRRVELESGKVLKKVDVPEPYFAEGIAVLNGKVYQLTWQHRSALSTMRSRLTVWGNSNIRARVGD